jgi:ribosomal protein S18 acetylase RimI-like enzyme
MYQLHTQPSLTDLRRWSDELITMGYTTVRTTALATSAALRVEAAGFQMIQELVLLEHLAPRRQARPALLTRRLLVSQRPAASAVDLSAFGDRWALEPFAVGDVCAATPRHRARGAHDGDGVLTAYAISGRDGKQGFLQRLAVAPAAQRQGLGRALVADSLHWLARWRVQRVLVNTPIDNEPALQLYEANGFHRLGERLRVYERMLT